ncbi:transposase [Rhizobium sp. Nf11,1]|uniref:transposase n=1 Tax=Rhizobium sp. Nf11,1 TaxID=3404923 RepID=UPI003D32792D
MHEASVQDPDGAPGPIEIATTSFPRRKSSLPTALCSENPENRAAPSKAWSLKIVKRSDKAKEFAVLPKRWILERTFAWLGHACSSIRTGKRQSPHPRLGSDRINPANGKSKSREPRKDNH